MILQKTESRVALDGNLLKTFQVKNGVIVRKGEQFSIVFFNLLFELIFRESVGASAWLDAIVLIVR